MLLTPIIQIKKLLLDYIIVSSSLIKHIDKLEVDKDLKWTPSRVKNSVLKFPDHYALLLTLKNIPMMEKMKVVNRKQIRWNTRKPNGWQRYKSLTEENEKLLALA